MKDPNNNPEQGLFSHIDDFASVNMVVTKFPAILELKLKNKEHYNTIIDRTNKDIDNIPLFLKDTDGNLQIISSYNKEVAHVEDGFKLAYLGRPLDAEALRPDN